MENPDRLSAHEKRIVEQLDKVEADLVLLQDFPATPENRLIQLKLQFKQQVLFNSWYTKDKDETYEGMLLIQEERNQRAYWETCLFKVISILDNLNKIKQQQPDARLDLSGVEHWLQGPE